MRLFIVTIVLFIFVRCQMPMDNQQPVISSLNNSSWFFSEQDSTMQYPANVPGSVHMDLLENGLIIEPYNRDNEAQLQWIGERNWNYYTSFDVSDETLQQQQIELCFEGLDTHAEVYLNEKPIISANNYFRTWTADVKEVLKKGANNLEVRFKSPVHINKALCGEDSIPLFDDYVYTRKPAFHFGWDWGPVFITAGIWRPVYIKAWSNAIISDSHIRQEKVNAQVAELKAFVEIDAAKSVEAQVIIECAEADIKEVIQVSLKQGSNTVSCDLHIHQPKLWWSNGLGEAHLYQIKTTLVKERKVLDRKALSIGVRDLKLVQNPDDKGASFHFELNGVPVFAKGANYIPQESFQSKVDSADYRQVIQHALDANMNMLRVWGGGFYEEDYFYDLCDQHGILVWQDFMFACSMYPGEQEYLENVRQEAIENVKRLRNHPSLALWCGNNENYIGWQDWRWSNRYSKEDSAKVWQDYEALFHHLLPDVIAECDAGKAYWPSSPKYGWGYPVNKEGDVHLWAVWHAQDPFEVFLEEENIGRFMSEYGFQSLPEMKTIEAFTLPEDRHMDSEVMKSHQKHRVGYPVIDKYIKRDYQWPKDFESYVYVSQVLQAKGIKMAIEAHRRAMPFCMGTLYWQLNDCWPVASWSSVDYYNRWKALHYKVREAYANVLVSPVVNGDKVEVFLVSDRPVEKKGQLVATLFDFEGNRIWETMEAVTITANTSNQVTSYAVDSILKGHASNAVVLSVELLENEVVISRNNLYLKAPKELELKKTDISYTIEKRAGDTLQIQLQTTYLAKDVCLTFAKTDGFFSDNYFDLIPGETKKVSFISKGISHSEGEDQLVIKTLVDTY